VWVVALGIEQASIRSQSRAANNALKERKRPALPALQGVDHPPGRENLLPSFRPFIPFPPVGRLVSELPEMTGAGGEDSKHIRRPAEPLRRGVKPPKDTQPSGTLIDDWSTRQREHGGLGFIHDPGNVRA